jgi:hypothetical protein
MVSLSLAILVEKLLKTLFVSHSFASHASAPLSQSMYLRLWLVHLKVLLVWVHVIHRSMPETSCYLGVLRTFRIRRPPTERTWCTFFIYTIFFELNFRSIVPVPWTEACNLFPLGHRNPGEMIKREYNNVRTHMNISTSINLPIRWLKTENTKCRLPYPLSPSLSAVIVFTLLFFPRRSAQSRQSLEKCPISPHVK